MSRASSAILLLLLAAAASARASEPDCVPADFKRPRAATESEEGCFFSPTTGGPVRYRATFPAGFDPAAKDPYAIFLHGRGGNEKQFTDFGGEEAIDEYVKKGGRPFVVIAPAEPKHSYWKDGPAGEFGTAHMVASDLVKHVEDTGAVAAGDRRERGIFGLSMGGHGSFFVAETRPEVFSAVYSMSPVFRGEPELEAEDRPASGSGPAFDAQDPVKLYHEGQGPGVVRAVEMGRDDWFLGVSPRTKDFLAELQKALGPEAVNLERPGGHDADYWRGAFKRAVKFLGRNFTALTPEDCLRSLPLAPAEAQELARFLGNVLAKAP